MSTPTPPLNDLVTKIRAKYPGAYDDMDDASLTKAVLKKYPQYSDLAAPPMPHSTPGDVVPTPNMQQSILGNLQGGPTGIGQGGNLPSPKGQMAAQQTPSPAVGATILGGAAGSAMSGAAAIPILGVAGKLAAENPIKTYMALQLAKKIPGVGETINKIPGVDLLPFLASEGASGAQNAARGKLGLPKPTVAAGEEAATAEAATAETAAGNVPVGKFTKEQPNPPYVGPRVPDKMELVDSTNVTKVGYHPESKTMMVEYRNGRVYEYRGVPEELYGQAKDAESVGSYISRNIKGRYETNYRGSVLGKK